MAYFSLKESLTYWNDYISFIIFSVLGLVLQISAWYALYSSVDFAPVMGRSYETMITYYLIMQIVRNFTSADGIAGTLEQRMSTGEIATDMLRRHLDCPRLGRKALLLYPVYSDFCGVCFGCRGDTASRVSRRVCGLLCIALFGLLNQPHV